MAKGYQIIFFLLSVFNILAKLYVGVNYLTYFVYIYLVALVLVRVIDVDEFLVYSLFVPNKYLQICSILLFVIVAYGLKCLKIEKRVFKFIGFILTSGIINCLIYNGPILTTVFQTGFYYCVFLLIKQFNKDLDVRRTIRQLDFVFLLEITTSILDLVITGKIGDAIQGTFESAHYLGVFLLCYIYLLFKVKDSRKSRFEVAIRLVLATLIFYIADAKHVIAIVAFSFLLILILNKLKIKRQLLLTSVLLTIVVVFGLLVTSNFNINFLTNNKLYNSYVLNENYNLKYRYFEKTFEQMKSLNGLFGFGPGQFGSQISLSLSKGLTYPWNTSLSSYKYAIEPYSNVLDGLFSRWYSEIGIIQSSMVLSYPLVSYIGMIAELGLIGYFWFFYLMDFFYKNKNKSFLIAFMIMTIFDTYFEIACVFIMILIVSNVSQQKGRMRIE